MSLLCTDLVKAVPDEHKKFLADLVWVHEEVRIVLVAFFLIFRKFNSPLVQFPPLVQFGLPFVL